MDLRNRPNECVTWICNLMANMNFNGGKLQIKYDSCPTEVIWKWQQYGNNFIAIFGLSPLPSKMFFNLSANNPVAGNWNQSDI